MSMFEIWGGGLCSTISFRFRGPVFLEGFYIFVIYLAFKAFYLHGVFTSVRTVYAPSIMCFACPGGEIY